MTAPRYQALERRDIPAVPLAAASSPAPTCTGDDRGSGADDGLQQAVGEVRIIAGTFNGVAGPAQTTTPIDMWDIKLHTTAVPVTLQVPQGAPTHSTRALLSRACTLVANRLSSPSITSTAASLRLWQSFTCAIPRAAHNAMLLVRRGGLRVGSESKAVGAASLVAFDRSGGAIRVEATEPDTLVLLLAGEPIDEPIAARGPFVMNSDEEIIQANRDFREGKMGR